MQHEVDSGSRTTILVHYYRAMVGRADVWRTRMDTTTHWAIGATAAIMSFTLSNASVPHYVAGIATLMTLSFLLLEARRLTFYHLWQQRVLLLERGLVRPALWSGGRDAGNVAFAVNPLVGYGCKGGAETVYLPYPFLGDLMVLMKTLGHAVGLAQAQSALPSWAVSM